MTRRPVIVSAVAALLLALCLEVGFSARQQSQTFDEAAHILAGVHYWHDRDYGINPEHPPLVKLVAALPLLGLRLQMPAVPEGYFKTVEYFAGRDFLAANSNREAILFRGRMAAAFFTVFLAVLVFAAAAEMFGAWPGLVALLLVAFEPNVLAHGALVTTDVGVTCCLFLVVYAFYRYVKKPSALRLAKVGFAAGLALTAKHSGLLALPILAMLAGFEIWRSAREDERNGKWKAAALQLAGALAVVGAIAFSMVWAVYGFRYAARPGGLAMTPDLATFAAQLTNPAAAWAIGALGRWHLLPEAYLYGLADVLKTTGETPGFLFGKIYFGGKWFYFPAVLAIKCTLGFLLLLVMVPAARAIRSVEKRREIAFLAIPAGFYLLVAMGSSLNLGVRHILPVLPFLLVLAGYGAWSLTRQNCMWTYAVVALLVFHVESSARAFPNYIAYSNEIAGGPARTFKVLSESNVDWGQSLKAMKRYVDEHNIKDCWFADFAALGADPAAYGIPCKLLPAGVTRALSIEIVPPVIAGPVFVSATELSGSYWGPGELNPYAQFLRARPDGEIGGAIFAFNGGGSVPLLSAVTHESRAGFLAQNNDAAQALTEAEAAAALAPGSVDAQAGLGDALMRVNRMAEARQAYEKALMLARTVEPDYQRTWVAPLQTALQRLGGG